MERMETWVNTSCGVFASFLIHNMQTIQAIITFSLTTAYLIYKLKEARLNAALKQKQVDEYGKRTKRKRH